VDKLLMPYTLVDHTADIGIHVIGDSLKSLFTDAALAMFEQITDISKLEGRNKKQMSVTGLDRHDLLINWLRELLSFWTIDVQLVKQVEILELDETRIKADVIYDFYTPGTYDINKDIKAVTYYGVSVDQIADGWEATVIFDV
jgi:SHS2 domain-containing protein